VVAKYKLNLAVGFTILFITIWLISARRVWDWVGQLMLTGAVVLIAWTVVWREKKPAKLLEFFIKSLVVSYVATSMFWFGMLAIVSPSYFAYLNGELLMSILIFTVLPLALLPVAVAVLIYGKFRVRLKTWEFFLSIWYVTVFAVFNGYQLWWSLFIRPNLPDFYYSSVAGAIALAILLMFLAFFIAGGVTVVYAILGQPQTEPPP